MKHFVIELIGWLGVFLCTLGYLLLSLNVIRSNSFYFQFINIFGGLCLSVSAIENNDLPNVIANMLWMGIGIYAYSKYLKRVRRHFRRKKI